MSSLVFHTSTDRRYDETTLHLIAAEAAIIWQGLTPQQQTLIRFGMFPADVMRTFEAKFPEVKPTDRARLCAVALMDCAQAGGGMQA